MQKICFFLILFTSSFIYLPIFYRRVTRLNGVSISFARNFSLSSFWFLFFLSFRFFLFPFSVLADKNDDLPDAVCSNPNKKKISINFIQFVSILLFALCVPLFLNHILKMWFWYFLNPSSDYFCIYLYSFFEIIILFNLVFFIFNSIFYLISIIIY